MSVVLAGGCCLAGAAWGANRRAFADARAEAMAGGPALAAGFYALGTNPAMLVALPAIQVGFSHKDHATPGATSEVVGGAYPLGAYGTAAAGAGVVRVGGVERWDANGNYLGAYAYHEDRLAVGYGVKAARWFAVGGAFHYDHFRTRPEDSQSTVGVDAGVFLNTPDLFAGATGVGIGGQNLLVSRRELYFKYREPLRVNVGASWARYIGNHRLTLTLSGPVEKPVAVGFGAEFLVLSAFAARVGVVGTRPMGGFGYNTNLFSFDYCYRSEELGNYHYFSFSVNPGRDVRQREDRRRQLEELLAEGLAYYDAGNYGRAADRFAAVLKYDENNVVAREYDVKARYYVQLAKSNEFLREQRWPEARAACEEALMLVPADFLATEYLARVNQLEKEEEARRAEEKRIAEKFKAAEDAARRGAYRQALTLSQEILAAYPDHEGAGALLADARRRLAEIRTAAGEPPEEEPAPPAPAIPAEVVVRYRQGRSFLSRGALVQAITVLADVVKEYPTYGAARAKLVEALLYQGLEFYSKGAVAAALGVWRQASALDPSNAKAKRYIAEVEPELK